MINGCTFFSIRSRNCSTVNNHFGSMTSTITTDTVIITLKHTTVYCQFCHFTTGTIIAISQLHCYINTFHPIIINATFTVTAVIDSQLGTTTYKNHRILSFQHLFQPRSLSLYAMTIQIKCQCSLNNQRSEKSNILFQNKVSAGFGNRFHFRYCRINYFKVRIGR